MKYEYVITPEMVYGFDLPVAPEGYDLKFRPPRRGEPYFSRCGYRVTALLDLRAWQPHFVLVPKPAPPKPRRWIIEEGAGDEYGRLKYLASATLIHGVGSRVISCRVVEEIKR